MLVKTIEEVIPSTCFILRFAELSDYDKVYNELNTPFYWNIEEFNMFHHTPTSNEIDVEIADSFIEDFIGLLKDIKDLKSGFIMTTDLTKAPEYTFGDVKELLNTIDMEDYER